MATPLTQLPRDARRLAKAHLVAGMNAGLSWHRAAEAADVTLSEATAHRLRRLVRLRGEQGLDDRRCGTAYKLSPPIRQWLVAYCHDHPHTPSRLLQTVLADQHAVRVRLSQPDSCRPGYPLSAAPTPKKTQTVATGADPHPWHAGAGSLLLLAAAH